MRAVGLLGLGTLAAVAGSVAAAAHTGSPVRVGGVERTDTWAVLFLVLFAVAFAFYVSALLVLRARRSPLLLVAGLAVAIQLVPLAGPLLLSRDVYSYWAYGRIVATHDRNPFTSPPLTFPHDPATRAARWRNQTSVYGPGFTLASAAVAGSARSGERVALLFRVVAALAGLGATALAAFVARRKAFAAAFVGWNPLLALSFAGGGHNDAWMLALLLAAVALVARRRDVEAGVLWLFAAAIKAPALLLLPLQLLRARRGLWLGAAGAALAIAAAATFVFGTAWTGAAWRLAGREAAVGLPARLEQLGAGEGVAHGAAYGVLAVGAAFIVLRTRRGRPSLALAAALFVFTSPWVLPWYATWPVALAAVEEDALGQAAALLLVLYLLPDRVPL